MTVFCGLAVTEMRLQWRSRVLWATVLLTLLFAVLGTRETYFAAAQIVAGSLTAYASLGLALVWVASARRPHLYRTADLVESSPLPHFVRMGAEVAGSFMGLVALVLLVIGLDTAVSTLLRPDGMGGLARDLMLGGLLIGPPLLAWLGLARLIGRFLPSVVGYVVVALLWGACLWAGTLLPVPMEWSLAYLPLGASDLTLYGVDGSRLLLQRGVLAGVGALTILLSCFPERQNRRWVMTVAPALLGMVALVLLAAVPGVKAVQATAGPPDAAHDWAARAHRDGRWRLVPTDSGDVLVAHHHADWASPLMSAIKQVRPVSGVGTGSLVLTVVEAPVSEPLWENDLLVIPDWAFRRLTSREQLLRRVITLGVARQSDTWPAAGTNAWWKPQFTQGIILYTEWRYVDALLGNEVATEEIDVWVGMMERAMSRQFASGAAQAPGPATGLRPDPSQLRDWRGTGLVSDVALQTARELWKHFAHVPTAELPGLTERWLTVIRQAPPEMTVEEIRSRLMEAAQ